MAANKETREFCMGTIQTFLSARKEMLKDG